MPGVWRHPRLLTRPSGHGVRLQPWIPAIPAGAGKWIEAPELQSREIRFASFGRIQTKAEDRRDRLSLSAAVLHGRANGSRHCPFQQPKAGYLHQKRLAGPFAAQPSPAHSAAPKLISIHKIYAAGHGAIVETVALRGGETEDRFDAPIYAGAAYFPMSKELCP